MTGHRAGKRKRAAVTAAIARRIEELHRELSDVLMWADISDTQRILSAPRAKEIKAKIAKCRELLEPKEITK